jgi:hypothetical protein
MIAKLAVVAALAGSGIGAAAVLSADRTPEPARVPAVATPSGPAKDAPPPLAASDLRIVLRQRDPAGGAPWAVRRYSAKMPPGIEVLCFELGRLNGDRFGRIDGTGRFAEQPAGYFAAANTCGPKGQPRQFGAAAMRFTTLDLSVAGAPRPLETVTWGVAAASVRAVVPAGEAEIPVRDGLFLEVRPGEGPGGRLNGMLVGSDGGRTPFGHIDAPRPKGEHAVAGTDYPAARAPDPAGGEPWGVMAARGSRGGVCLSQPVRLVGDQVGRVDRALNIFIAGASEPPFCPDAKRRPTRAFPMRLDTLISNVGGEDPRGRIERRVLDSRMVFWGRVHEDVVSVTIRTPRDVRTLVPASAAHAIIAVYDGRFPGGNVTATARMKDGREVTRTLYAE